MGGVTVVGLSGQTRLVKGHGAWEVEGTYSQRVPECAPLSSKAVEGVSTWCIWVMSAGMGTHPDITAVGVGCGSAWRSSQWGSGSD